MQKIKEFYSFDDVLIEPQFSDFIPREANTETKITKSISLNIPIISAAMDTVTEDDMAISMALIGGIGVIHKSLSIDEQCNQVKNVKEHKFDLSSNQRACLDLNNNLRVLAAVGTGEEAVSRAKSLISVDIDGIVIDTSHGHSQNVLDTIFKIKNISPKTEIIAGNIATKNAAIALLDAGADSVKVGIGPGSICTTRIVTGVGVPQLGAIMDIAEVCKARKSFLIADGGIKSSGDIAKAIAGGADSVMLGSLLAGTQESPGEMTIINNKKYKKYRGMGSIEAMKSGSADRYYQKGELNLVPQGVEGYVEYKGSVNSVINQLLVGLMSAMGYTGNENINKMKQNCRFIKVSASCLKENHVHSLSKSEPTINYKYNI